MKKILSVILVMVMILALCACGGNGEGGSVKKEGLQVGFGREMIMPEDKVNIAGGEAAARISNGYADYLYVTCVAVSEGEDTVLMYTMDFITMSVAFSDAAEAAITEATGIPAENILMNATHTHAGPSIRSSGYDWVPAYRELFNNAAVKAATDAIADQSAATLYAGGVQTEGMAFVRHYTISDGSYAGANFGNFSAGSITGYACEADEELQIVKFAREAEDKKDVVLMNFPAHATFNQSGTTLSADYPSPTRDYIENNSDSLVAFFIGAAGNQVPTSRIPGESFSKEYRAYGQKLGQYVVDALPTLAEVSGNGIKLSTKTLTLPSCKDGLEKLEEAKETNAAGKTYGYKAAQTVQLISKYGFSSIYEANAIVSRASAAETKNMTINTMAIGDLSFVFAPYEMAGVHAIGIKEGSPYENTFVITCFEDHVGYLPTREACVDFKSYEYCVTNFAVGTGEQMIDEYIKMLTEMKGA